MFHTIKLSKTNLYLFKTTEGYIQFDTGYDSDWESYLKIVKGLQISLSEISYLILSHHHDDHVGFINRLVKENSSLKVIMHQNCVSLISKGVNSREYGGAWATKRMKFLADLYRRSQKGWTLSFEPYEKREVDIVLDSEQGSLTELTGLNLEYIYTPGHTSDSISILDSEGNLFCGDAAANYMLIAGTRYAPPFITNLKQFYDSWEKLIADRRIVTIYPAHGKPFKAGQLKKHLRKLDEKGMGKFEWD